MWKIMILCTALCAITSHNKMAKAKLDMLKSKSSPTQWLFPKPLKLSLRLKGKALSVQNWMKMTSIFTSAVPFWVPRNGRLKSILMHSALPTSPSPFADQEPEAQFLLLIFTNKPLVYLLHTKYIRCRRRPPPSAAVAAANTYIDIQNWCNLYYYYYYRASRDHEIHIQSNLAIRNWKS